MDGTSSRRMHTAMRPSPPGSWRVTLAGFSASLVGIGLARFAYTPLLPAIIQAHWFAAASAAYLGAANLAGYLAGALLAHRLTRWSGAATSIRLMMVLTAVALFACAIPVSFLWFFLWRFASGLSGGVLMVLAAPTVLPLVPASRRGLAGGVIFMGVGAGIALSGTVVPLLLHHGLTATWLGLGAMAALLTLASWRSWPSDEVKDVATTHHGHAQRNGRLRTLYVGYALNAVALVPHMIFLVDFVARGLGLGLEAGAEYWVLFGIGAVVGPLVTGHLADRTGFAPALRLAFLIEGVAVLLPALGLGQIALMLSSVVMGAFTPGIVPLALGRVHELLPHHPEAQKAAWSAATTSFAVLQAMAAYGMSFLFSHHGGDYRGLFVIGAVAMALALAIDLIAAVVAGNKDRSPAT